MSQRAATRGFFLCILAFLAAPAAEAQITFAPPTVAFGVGETSPLITATITYVATPPTGQQSLTISGDPGITTLPPTVTFMPPASPGSVNVSFQLVAAGSAIPGTGNELSVSTLGAGSDLFMYDLFPVGVWPQPVLAVQGSSTGPITATMHWDSTPPGGTQELVIGGLPPGATTVPSPVTFTPPTGWDTTVTFSITTTAATPLGVHTLTASTASIVGGVATFDLVVQPPPTITVVPASGAVTACTGGPPVPNSVTVTATGISGAGQVTFPGLPSGLTITPTPPILTSLGPTPQVVPFDVSAAFGLAPGPYTVTVAVSDINGAVLGSATFTVNVLATDFFPFLSPASLTLAPGGSSAVVVASASAPVCPPGSSILVTPGALPFGDVQPVPIPPGITITPSELVLDYPGFGGQPFTVSVSLAASPGSYRIPFLFSPDGGPEKVLELQITVRSPGDLSVTVEKPSVSVCPGGPAAQNSVVVDALEGYSGTPTLTFPVLPAGIKVTPSSIPVDEVPPARTVSFEVTALAGTSPGPKVVNVLASDPFGPTGSTSFVVNVGAADFDPVVSPAPVTLTAGGPEVGVTASISPGSCSPPSSILVTPTGLPEGVTAMPASAELVGPDYAPAVFALSASGSAPAGSAQATFVFEPSTGAPKPAPVTVSVLRTGRIGVEVERASVAVCPGGAGGTNSLTITSIDGYVGAPAVTFGEVPDGLTVDPVVITVPEVPPSRVVAFTVSAAPGTAPGPRTVNVLVSDPAGPSTAATFVVDVLPPDFLPVVWPADLLLDAGGAAGALAVSLSPGSCAPAADVVVTPSGLPPGISASPESVVLVPPDYAAAEFAIEASSSALPGTSSFTLTWTTPDGTTRTATATVTVCGPPDAPASPVVTPRGNPQGPVTATDALDLSWGAPAAGAVPNRYEWRLNGGAWNATAGTSATAPPRGAVDPLQLFVRAFACNPEKGPGPEAASPVYSLAPPVADFSLAEAVFAGRPVTFTDTSSPQATSWLWFPGDGMAAVTVQSPTVTFPSAGPRVVVLVATNGSGSSSKSVTVNVFPASMAPTAGSLAVRSLDRRPDGRLALDRVEVEAGTTLLLRRLDGDGPAVAWLRLVDADGRVVVERRLVLAEGEEARHDLAAWGATGALRLEVVGPEGLEAVVEEAAIRLGGPEEPVRPRRPGGVRLR